MPRLPGSPDETKSRVLIVDDEEVIRMVAAEYLSSTGFTVLQAANAEAARDVITSEVGVDLVFSDINMPGSMDGEGLADWVAIHYPRLPVVLTSGIARSRLTDPRRRFLAKPYALARLEKLIRELLR